MILYVWKMHLDLQNVFIPIKCYLSLNIEYFVEICYNTINTI